MTVDAALLGVSRYTGQECIADLVVFAGGGKFLRNGVFVLRQEVLGKRRQTRFGAAIRYA